MVAKPGKPANVDAYIASFPPEVQAVLQQVRATVQKAAPAAEETIKYDMPTYVLNGNLVYFAGYKNHIGFYPAPVNDEAFKEVLSKYKTGRGSVQFPLSQPMPLQLITRIVKQRIKQNAEKAKAKAKRG
ncbi:DUF1801 domain-containing protein [Nemorincola caseinilytica]|uniref:DUF1801 domain-containing protein n=1 Tax=Nemorincola caseinilytica TaxID=2054315 RepID=A0ABP8NMG8_9BACT